MKKQYSLRDAERGKFHRPGAVFRIPVYLDQPVQLYLSGKARKKGVQLSELVNDLLKKEIALIEAVE